VTCLQAEQRLIEIKITSNNFLTSASKYVTNGATYKTGLKLAPNQENI
jgi:hypothetical protein